MSFVIQKHSLVDRGELHRAICCFAFLFLVSVRLVVFCFVLFFSVHLAEQKLTNGP